MSFPILVRCLLRQNGGQWEAYTLEFGLAAQAESAVVAKRKLHDMLNDYLYDALAGEDREHADELLSRKAEPRVYFWYYVSRMLTKFRGDGAYKDPVPLMPIGCHA
jgi:hypothetical protein